MVAPLEPEDPRTLGGFRLSGRLGEGGQGVVYLGYAPDGEPVAVKVLKAGFDGAVRERLARELDAMRGVAPFCTARLITAEFRGREPYVVSEFVDGPSLQQRVAASGPLRGGELERLAVGTATALAAIHAAGIVHRDFKPGNVLLGPDGPRVVDFGIARQGESETITAGPVGTPAYLAPEQIAGHVATPASDVFAWGATIVFAATGRTAFGADNVAAVLHRVLTTFPDLTPVPPPLRSPVERCLAKDPAARPSSRDLLLELVGGAPDPLRAGVAVSAPASGPVNGPMNGPASGAAPVPSPYDTPATRPPGWDSGTASPGAVRRGARVRLLAGTGAAVAALGVTAALLIPRLTGSTPTRDVTPTYAAQNTSTQDTSTQDTSTSPTPAAQSPTRTPAGTAAIPAAFAGKWRGHIVPSVAGVMQEHDIEVELRRGEATGRWKEPDSSCEGTLRLTEGTGSALTFRLEDVSGCVPGTVVLTREGAGLAYRWDDDLGVVNYQGDLARDS